MKEKLTMLLLHVANGDIDHTNLLLFPIARLEGLPTGNRRGKVVAEDLPLRRGELLTIALPTIGIADTAPQNCGGTWRQ